MLKTVMSSSTSSSSVASIGATNVVFEIGKYKVVLQRAEPVTTCSTKSSNIPVPPPKPLLIGMPCEAGEFPILLLLHGYLLSNSFYSQLIQHIASHGFIVVAPQARLSLFHLDAHFINCDYTYLTKNFSSLFDN